VQRADDRRVEAAEGPERLGSLGSAGGWSTNASPSPGRRATRGSSSGRTNALADARRIYERAGFALDEEGRHTSFGHDLVEQTWSRLL
jgi:hypothetical protein